MSVVVGKNSFRFRSSLIHAYIHTGKVTKWSVPLSYGLGPMVHPMNGVSHCQFLQDHRLGLVVSPGWSLGQIIAGVIHTGHSHTSLCGWNITLERECFPRKCQFLQSGIDSLGFQ